MLASTQPRPAARLSLWPPFWTGDWVVAQGVGAQVKTFSSVINIRDGDGYGPAFPALSLDPAHQNLGSVAIISHVFFRCVPVLPPCGLSSSDEASSAPWPGDPLPDVSSRWFLSQLAVQRQRCYFLLSWVREFLRSAFATVTYECERNRDAS